MIVDSGPPSLLDSPTLARVERARIRDEGEAAVRSSPVKLSTYCPSVVSDRGEMQHAIKKGLLWQQRERLFSRWKERFFILTRDYLHCFKRSTGQDKISDMGQFIFKVKLVEVETIEWINKKSYSTIAIQCRVGGGGGGVGRGDRESRVLLRAPDGLEDWYELLEECMMTSKERRRALRRLHNPLWTGDDDSPSLTWLISRGTLNREGHLSDSVPDLEGRGRGSAGGEGADELLWARARGTPLEQRLSLLTDIDINSCSSQTETPPPSVAATLRGRPYPCRLNADVFFMSSVNSGKREGSVAASYCSSRSPLTLTPAGSFRNGHQLFSPAKTAAAAAAHVKYRDRSQSDALNWTSRTAELKSRRSSYLNDVTHV